MTSFRASVLTLWFIFLGGCSFSLPQHLSSDSPAQLNSASNSISERQLQAAVMVFSDHFAMIYWQASDDILRSGITPAEELAIQHNKVLYTSSAMNIAAQPNPTAALIDMITFVRLGHYAVKSHWIPKVFGAKGKPLVEAYKKLESEVWELSAQVLTSEQQEEVLNLIDKWRNEHPNQWYIAGIHSDGLPASRGKPVHPIYQDGDGIMSTVSEGLVKVDEAMMIADRALFLSERLPRLLTLQGEALVAQITKNPLILQVTSDISEFKGLGSQLTQSFEELPEAISQERQKTLEHLFSLIGQERKQFTTSLIDQEELLLKVLNDTQNTLQTGSETAKMYIRLVEAIEELVEISGLSSTTTSNNEEKENGLAKANDLLLKTQQTAQEINTLMVSFNNLLSLETAEDRESAIDTLLIKLVDTEKAMVSQIFWYSLGLILIISLSIFFLCLLYRVIIRALAQK